MVKLGHKKTVDQTFRVSEYRCQSVLITAENDLSWQQVLSHKYQYHYQYQRSKYQYKYQYLACKYKYKYSTIVLQYRSSTSTSTQYNKTASQITLPTASMLDVWMLVIYLENFVYAYNAPFSHPE